MIDRTDEQSVQRVLDGTTWFEFCDILKMAGYTITRDSSPDTDFDRAEGFRYLARITRAALDAFIDRADVVHPTLYRPVHETIKMGADNPDNHYQHANISGARRYRLHGTRGTIHYLGFGTYAGDYGSGGRTGKTGYLEGRDLVVSPDGTFEVILSCEEPTDAQNWLPTEPDTTQLIVRQMFLDRSSETIAELQLECLDDDADAPPPPLTAPEIDQRLSQASRFVVGAAALFANWAEGWAAQPNTLPRFDANESLAAHGDPNIVYFHGYWELGENEALVIDATPPACDYWNFQVNNHWMESLDYRYHPIAVNKHGADYRPDGSVRVVVSSQRPAALDAHTNWLTTDAHRRGTMCWRWVRADENPAPQTRVVELDAFPLEG